MEQVVNLVHQMSEVNVLLVSETWFNAGDAGFNKIEGFALYHSDRIGRRGGGVAVYIRNEIHVRVNFARSTFTFDIIHLSLQLHRVKQDVILVYNSNKTNLPLLLRELENILSSSNGQSALIFGDFNINLFDKDTDQDRYLDLLHTFNFGWVNTEYPTRESANLNSCIDHVFVNDFQFGYDVHIVLNDISDHNIIVLDCYREGCYVEKNRITNVIKMVLPGRVKEALRKKPFHESSESACGLAEDLENYIADVVNKEVLRRELE